MPRILVTGANGWVGRSLCQTLIARGHSVTGIVRRGEGVPHSLSASSIAPLPPSMEIRAAGDDLVDLEHAWPAALAVDAVVHLAARVHVMHESAANADALYEASNCAASVRVARLARARGVRRFVFLSSIKALGEQDDGQPLRETSPARPEDAYGRSKWHAEQALTALDGLELVIVRAPLVYGPGVRANFLRLMDLVARGWPLPLGRAYARRSLVAQDNLCDALVHCALDARAVGQTFHVADPESPSVRELIEALAQALGRQAHLLPVPIGLLRSSARWLGRGAEIARLTTSLRVDTAHIETTLGWRTPHTMTEALAHTAAWYQHRAAA